MDENRCEERVGVDVGGTFTDFVMLDDGRLRVHKEPTSRPQHRAVVQGLEAMGVPERATVAHGTTTATNALLERRGARTGLITSEGIADVLVIGRQDRPDLYALHPTRPEPLVPEGLRVALPERLGAGGEVVVPLDETAVREAARSMAEAGVESVAIVFLFSFRDGRHEARAAQIVRDELGDGVPVTCSHVLLPEHREYERTATTVVNAYVRPQVERYLKRLREGMGERPVRVMQSNGGTIGADLAGTQAARLALSGPAGGVVGALEVARRSLDTDAPRILTLDMGGTSTDVALCDGEVPRTTEHEVAGVPLRLPSTDIHTVGAGGGSLARVDDGGSLRVGPESAGADPGPAAYGRGGTRPTVTDAHLVLGRLSPHHFLGGDATLDRAASESALQPVADALGRDLTAAAGGIVRIANATMERALRRVSVERGHDPRQYTLVPSGGAGPLHACNLAGALDVPRVLVPPAPGVLSALGLLAADVVYDTARAVLHAAGDLREDATPLAKAATAARDDVAATLEADATAADGALRLDYAVDARYRGQSYELTVDLDVPVTAGAVGDAVRRFHERHDARFGHADRSAAVEIVAVRARGTVPTPPLDLRHEPPTDRPLHDAHRGTREVVFDGEPVHADLYDRSDLRHGHVFTGPAVVHQYDTTTVIPPGWTSRVDGWGSLVVEHAGAPS